MRYLLGLQVFNQCHNLSNSGFIVSSQNGCAVGRDQCVTGQSFEMLEHIRTKNKTTASKGQIFAIIIFSYDWLNCMFAIIRYSIYMSNKTKCRSIFISFRGWKFSIEKTMFGEMNVRNTEDLHFIFQKISQVKLTF